MPGNIIFRQRGTHWFPGENCDMGRDHTIFATQPGFVKYYRDPAKHKERQYIGVVFERNWVLPTPPNAPRRRRLGMVATQRATPIKPMIATSLPTAPEANEEVEAVVAELPKREAGDMAKKTREGTTLKMRPNYQFREGNWEIGQAAERAGVQVRPFVKGDRFLAWRKANARKVKIAEKRSMGRGGKKAKGKPGQKK